jgi:oxygen-independent coproporphyrinogen-3 oxidase
VYSHSRLKTLRRMGRRHTAEDALWAFAELRDAGFDNISLDLIAGYPGQERDTFVESLRRALQLRPEHISAYLLEVKPGTPLAKDIAQGVSPPVDDDLAADMYEDLLRITGEHGYEHYEISNFALPGLRSRHNLKYWRDVPFLGLGAAAHGMTGRVRYAHVEDTRQYIAKVRNGDLPFSDYRELTGEERLKDALIMGLRLVEGIDLGLLSDRYRVDIRPFIEETIGDLIEIGLCERIGDRLRLTDRGRLLSNMVFTRWL